MPEVSIGGWLGHFQGLLSLVAENHLLSPFVRRRVHVGHTAQCGGPGEGHYQRDQLSCSHRQRQGEAASPHRWAVRKLVPLVQYGLEDETEHRCQSPQEDETRQSQSSRNPAVHVVVIRHGCLVSGRSRPEDRRNRSGGFHCLYTLPPPPSWGPCGGWRR
jgi:hypothetical protein